MDAGPMPGRPRDESARPAAARKKRFTHGIIGCGYDTIEPPPPEHGGFLRGSSFFYSTERRRANAAAVRECASGL